MRSACHKSNGNEALNEAERRRGNTVARVGWWLCGGGLGVTVSGALLMSSAGGDPSDFAQSTHSIGMVIMLAGFTTVLVGNRIPWLMQQKRRRASTLANRLRDIFSKSAVDNFEWDVIDRIQDSEMHRWSIMNPLVDIWRRIIVGDGKSWVLFANGTCVILMEPEDDLEAQAIELMREWGPVHAGCPAGDFNTITLPDDLGWVVTCHHNDILTYVSPNEMEREPEDVAVGLFGRSKRHQDSQDLQVIHVEDNRNHE